MLQPFSHNDIICDMVSSSALQAVSACVQMDEEPAPKAKLTAKEIKKAEQEEES